MTNTTDIADLIPKLHSEARRLLPRRLHGRLRPSDLAQSTAQVLLKAKISDISCLASWSRGVIRNLIAKALAREASLRNLHAEIIASGTISRQCAIEGSPASSTADDSFSDMLRAARLDGTEKTILQMYFVECETMRSIATTTGLPLSTLHNRFRQALDQVREACDAGARPA
jgi:RNA polymerase sigma factor (sigma-70 family)